MNYPLNDPELTITQKSAPLWATWVITLGILIGVMTTAGNFVPQAAKKILLYPLAIFVLAGIVSHYLALMCLVPVTRFQLTLLMCCILVGYVGQQYFSYQIYLAHQQRSAKPELINLLPAIKDDALASPEQRELKKRLEQEFNPGISDFFNWKYSQVIILKRVPGTLIFVVETALSWGIVFFLLWWIMPSELKFTQINSVADDSGDQP